MHDLDELIRQNTGFRSMADLLDSAPSYRPSCDMRQDAMRQIADAYDLAMAERGDARRAYRYGTPSPAQRGMLPGDQGLVHINQGKRDTECLAVLEDRALVVYEMPSGRRYLLDVPAAWSLRQLRDADSREWTANVRNISPNRPPKRWRALIEEGAHL